MVFALITFNRYNLSCCILISSLLLFQGCPAEDYNQECKNPHDTFQGCMRLLALDNQPVDLIVVQQRLLGNYSQLQIDMCGIIDRSGSPECFLSVCSLNGIFQMVSVNTNLFAAMIFWEVWLWILFIFGTELMYYVCWKMIYCPAEEWTVWQKTLEIHFLLVTTIHKIN